MKTRKETICLNMIVKNESHIIIETLNHLHSIFDFDYWVISDTGSTDNTKELIINFFKEMNVSGELVENEWKWFGPSRTDALNAAYNKTDYLLIFDADDKIKGNFELPDLLCEDAYNLKFKERCTYYRPLLINNRKKWEFKGIIHEYLYGLEECKQSVNIEGDYHIVSCRLGGFNLDPQKYNKQAIILENEYKKEMELKTDLGLAYRYAFYCAQSYKDCNDTDNAIIWYTKVADELPSWAQERFCSCIALGDLYRGKNDLEKSLRYYLKSVEFDNKRIEGISDAIELLNEKGMNILAVSLYKNYQNYNRKIDYLNRLFVTHSIYDDMIMEFNIAIIAYYMPAEEQTGYECCKKIINNQNFKSYTYLRTILNLSCINYKNRLLIDTNDERILLLQSLSKYILVFKKKNNDNTNKHVIEIYTFIYNLMLNKLKIDSNIDIIQNELQIEGSLNDINKQMYNFTFITKEHQKTNDLYNRYKSIALNDNNKEYYNKMCHFESISALYTLDFKNGYESCKYLIINKINLDINNVYFNMKFYIKEIENDTNIEERYILLQCLYIYKNKISRENTNLSEHIWNYSKEYIFKYNEYITDILNKKHKPESAKNSKKILIYTGFNDRPWNYTYALNNALGGSEKAVAFLTKELPKDYDIFISGDVEEEVIDNVTYINRCNLTKLLETNEFHTIIISRYVSFFLLYPNFKCHKLIISAHDSTGLINNIININMCPTDIIHLYLTIIDNIVVLTQWHKDSILESLNAFDNTNMKIINNGIHTENISSNLEYTEKIKNSFAYTSCSYRGLETLLQLWPSILEKIPDATLILSSYEKFPKNEEDDNMNTIIKQYSNSITHLGCLNENELKKLRNKTEYWFYPNTFPETSCITALEMLVSEVICIYYPLAGLNDTLGEYGITVNKGKEIETIQNIVNLSDYEKDEIRLKGKQYALRCSWVNRANEWINLMKLTPDSHDSP